MTEAQTPRIRSLKKSTDPTIVLPSTTPERGPVLCYAHGGHSMNPTLDELDVLEIQSYGDRPVEIGDVIVFQIEGRESPVVHRVADVTPEGIRTRGDSSNGHDAWLLQPRDITGRVVAAWRGQKRRRIARGTAGWLMALLLRGRRALDQSVSRLLHPVYRTLARWGILRHLLPVRLRPRVVVFRAGDRARLRLMLGRRMVGQYDARQREWHIRRPFRLFVDEAALPQLQEIEHNRPKRF